MNIPNIIYENNNKTAHAVQEYVRNHGRYSPSLRPFNRFATAFTEWWLVPSSEWPAYKYGKLCFHKYPRTSDGVLYTGYYVEKGLGGQLAGLPDVQKNLIMQVDWCWHKVVDWASKEQIDEVVEEVCRLSQASVRVLVEVHAFNKVPEADSERSAPSDTIEFEIASSSSPWQLIQPGQSTLHKFNDVVGISALIGSINADEDMDYFWADLIIGIRLRYGDGFSQGWSASDIWAKALEPWIGFVY